MTTQTEEATRPASVEQQIGRLEGGYDQLAQRVGSLEQSVDRLRSELTAKIDAQGESIRAELTAKIDAQGESLRAEIRSRFNTMMVVGATVVVAQFGALIAILLRS